MDKEYEGVDVGCVNLQGPMRRVDQNSIGIASGGLATAKAESGTED
jgi:hypothetical protein